MIQKSFNQFIIAIDPFEQELKFSEEALKELRFWVSEHPTSVEAVYVLSGIGNKTKSADQIEAARIALEAVVKNYKIPVPVKSTVLFEGSSSQKKCVSKLIQYAKAKKTNLIFLTSHGRRGLSHLVMGSFAERLVMDAPIPVMALGSKISKAASINKTLFPTDFSKKSEKAFRVLLSQVSSGIKQKILLFHSISAQFYYYDYGLLSFSGFISNDFWKEQKSAIKKTSDRWIEEAKKFGVQVEFQLDDKIHDQQKAVEAALKNNKISTVALAAYQSNGLFSRLIQSHHYHVWVCGPEAQKRASQVKPELKRLAMNKKKKGFSVKLESVHR